MFKNKEFDIEGSMPEIGVNVSDLVEYNKNANVVNQEILDLFPDLETGYNIIESIVLLGKVSYSLPTMIPTMSLSLIDELMVETMSKYELEKELPTILKNALFLKGSDAFIAIPKNSINKLISEKKPEEAEVKVSESIDFSNDYQKLIEKSMNVSNPYLCSIEEDDALDYLLNVPENHTITPTAFINSDFGETEEDGITIRVNSESLIPLTLKRGNKPLGYLLLVNDEYMEISTTSSYMDLDSDVILKDASTSELREEINNYKKRIGANSYGDDIPELSVLKEDYTAMIMHEIRGILDDKKISNLINTPNISSLTWVLFERALEKKQTNMVYIPADYVTYYAFNYRSNGTGKSLLETVQSLINMRAKLTFAKVRSETENSVPRKNIEVTIDSANKDPRKFMAEFKSAYFKKTAKMANWSTTSVRTASDWIQNLNTSIVFKHERIPYNEVVEDSKNSSGITVSEDFLKSIRNDIFRRFGITGSMIDDSSNNDFVAIRLLNNELTKNEMSRIQIKLMEHFSQHVRMVLRQDGFFNEILRRDISEKYRDYLRYLGNRIIKGMDKYNMNEESRKEWIFNYIIRKLECKLPTLINEDETELQKRFDAYASALDSAIEHMFISDDSLPKDLINEDITTLLETFKTTYKSMLLRKWMMENNYLVEVANMMTVVDGRTTLTNLNTYISDLIKLNKALKNYGYNIKELNKATGKIKLDIESVLPNKVEEEPPVKEPTKVETPAKKETDKADAGFEKPDGE